MPEFSPPFSDLLQLLADTQLFEGLLSEQKGREALPKLVDP
jgi:hypothetical protein